MRRLLMKIAPAIAYAATLLYVFWSPLAQGWGSIQWDAVSVHLLNISFSSALLHQHVLPAWTPYLFGGFPQIADLQVALWYPPMSLLAAFTHLSATGLLWETVLHYFLAALFMYLLARYLGAPRSAAWALGLVYSLSGFMVGHASHIGMMNAAAWLPLVVLLVMRALAERTWHWAIFAGVVLGISMLAGHFQVSLYMVLLIVLYAAWVAGGDAIGRRWRSAALTICMVSVVGAFAGGIAAIQYLPTFQLVSQLSRSDISLSIAESESLKPDALTGYLSWNHLGVATGPYTGPWDRTQNYLYIGLATLAAALAGAAWGMREKDTRSQAAFFSLVTLFSVAFALGPATPIHALLYHLPLIGSVRAPGNMLLLAHVSLICLAAVAWRRVPAKYLRAAGTVFLVLVCVDILPKDMQNKLLWARQIPSQIFANKPIADRVLDEERLLPLERRFRVWRVPGLDANESQYYRIDDFGGYNPLELRRHVLYSELMASHPRLMALAGIRYLPCSVTGGTQLPAPWAPGTCSIDGALPRVFMVGHFDVVGTEADALEAVQNVEPFSKAVVERDAALGTPEQLVTGGPIRYTAHIESQQPGSVRIRTQSDGDALLVSTQTYWPDWQATIDGVAAPIWRTDYLFQGVRVPAGTHTVELRFHSWLFPIGGAVTMATLVGALGCFIVLRRRSGRTGSEAV